VEIIIALLVSISITALSFILFVLLMHKFIKDKHKKYSTHSLTKLLAVLTFFLFVDGAYYSILFASQYGYISSKYFFVLSDIRYQIIPKLGIFISAVFIVHFIMEKRIEEFKKKEDSLEELEKLNHELEKKAADMESSQDNLQKKVVELEKFNDIAKSREENMVELIKKIELLESKLKIKK
jgi:hypothetical protein